MIPPESEPCWGSGNDRESEALMKKELCEQLVLECEQAIQKMGGDLYEVMKKAPLAWIIR